MMRAVYMCLVLTACGSNKLSNSCATDADCGELTCVTRYSFERTIAGQTACDIQAKVCTKRCTTDADCSSVDGKCSGKDRCGGAENLCGVK